MFCWEGPWVVRGVVREGSPLHAIGKQYRNHQQRNSWNCRVRKLCEGATVRSETPFILRQTMLRTLFTVGLIAMLGLVALKLVFGLLGPLVGLLFMLVGFAIRVVLIGAVLYFVIRVVSPSTAARMEKAIRG